MFVRFLPKISENDNKSSIGCPLKSTVYVKTENKMTESYAQLGALSL